MADMNRKTRRLEPTDPIPGAESVAVGDFWAWAYSNPLMNVDRGVFAEFLVGNALGLTGGEAIREAWEAFDFHYGGHGIEVKSAAYAQAWPQTSLSRISFDIEEKTAWKGQSNVWDHERYRRSSVYVFCLFAETNLEGANVLEVDKWEFYVVPTRVVDDVLGNQKSVGLARVRTLAEPVSYAGLKHAIEAACL